MGEESNIGFMIMMARNLLDLGKITPLDEALSRIRQTSANDLMKVAREMFNPGKLSTLIMQRD